LCCAIETDLLCNALKNMDDAGINVNLHVHDSIAASVDEDRVDALLPIFKQCMLDTPAWTKGLPVACDVDASARFG
jgi:hypothetical protein